MPTRTSGQATAEYVALLGVAAAALAVAGAAAGAPAIAGRVVATVRTAVCIVGGDVCRGSDAAAAGLAPCTLSERRRGTGGGLTLVSIRFGQHDEWAVAARSDGSVLVSRSRDSDAGLTGGVGVGVEVGPVGAELGVSGSYAFSVASGRAWEFPSTAAARRFLAAVAEGAADDARRWPPTWRFGDAGAESSVDVGAEAFGAGVAGFGAMADAAVGARVGRGLTTLYIQADVAGPAPFGVLGGGAGAQGRRMLLEYSRDRRGDRELAFRVAAPAHGGRVVETTGRLDLREPGNAAIAAALLRRRPPWPPSVIADLRRVVAHTVRHGVVERSVYAVHDASHELEAAARLGLAVGVDLEHTHVDRRLVAASAWTHGSPERRRIDCLPEAAA